MMSGATFRQITHPSSLTSPSRRLLLHWYRVGPTVAGSVAGWPCLSVRQVGSSVQLCLSNGIMLTAAEFPVIFLNSEAGDGLVVGGGV
jgi:hypothetical protein